jgi:hypothetical protein
VAATDTVLAALGKLQAQLANYTLNAAAAITGGTIAGVTVSNAVINTAALDTSLDLNFLSGVLNSRITFTRASVATYFDANGVMQTAASGVARFDHAPAIVDVATAPYVNAPLGLLIEESRTNSVRNSSAVGSTAGVVGSGGVLPTYWSFGGTPALTVSVVGTGFESGIPYVDLSFSGTTSSSFTLTIDLLACSATAVITSSAYLRLTAGTLANFGIDVCAWTYGGGSSGILPVTPTGAGLATQRFSVPNGAGSGLYTVGLLLYFLPTGAVSCTIRIGAPQLELGAFVTSYIPTTSAAVTRAADVATMPVGAWFNNAAGSLEVDFQQITGANIGGASFRTLVQFTDALSGYYQLLVNTVGVINFFVANDAGVQSASLLSSTIVPAVLTKTAVSYASGAYALTSNGLTPVTATGTPPVNPTTMWIGGVSGSNNLGTLDGYIRRIQYWPRALSTSELQQVTATATPALLNLAIDQCPIGAANPSSGAFTTITLSQAEIDASAYTTAPVTSGTVTIPGTAARCVINPAGTLAALTVVSPAAPSLGANSVQSLDILFTQAITSLTWTAGSGTSFGGAAMPSSVALGTCVRLLWVQSLSKWLHTVEV